MIHARHRQRCAERREDFDLTSTESSSSWKRRFLSDDYDSAEVDPTVRRRPRSHLRGPRGMAYFGVGAWAICSGSFVISGSYLGSVRIPAHSEVHPGGQPAAYGVQTAVRTDETSSCPSVLAAVHLSRQLCALIDLLHDLIGVFRIQELDV